MTEGGVRDTEEFLVIVEKHFRSVDGQSLAGIPRFPRSDWLMLMAEPRLRVTQTSSLGAEWTIDAPCHFRKGLRPLPQATYSIPRCWWR